MRWFDFPATFRGHFVTSILLGVLVAGAPGCSSLNLGQFLGGGGGGGGSFGLLINSNLASNVLGGINLADGSSAFAFGSFKPDGSINEVTGAVFTDPDGNVTQLELDGGLPSKAVGPDGSRIDVTYTERTATRLKGTATLTFAALDDADKVQTISFDADLAEAAEQLAQEIKTLLGLDVSDEAPPEDPGGRIKRTDSGPTASDVSRLVAGRDIATVVQNVTGKDAATAQLIALFWGPTYIYAFASLGYVMVQLMGKIIGVVVEALVNVVIGLTRAIVTAMFTPFVLMGELLRQAVHQPLIVLALIHGQNAGGIWVPPAPDL